MLRTVIRTVFFYFFITFAYRIMGKREVGQLGIIDLIVSILIAELVAISIENYNNSIWLTILPIVILVILELVLGFFSVKSRKLNRILGGKPTLIIDNGKLLFKNLVSQRYSLDDLLLELRGKGIISIEDVSYAFLEPNGSLSIFEKKSSSKVNPLPVIIEGVIQTSVLKDLNKTEVWLKKVLEDNDLALEDVFYALYKKSHVYIIKYS